MHYLFETLSTSTDISCVEM